MNEELYARQSGLVDESIFKHQVTVIGAGGIGSFTTLALAKVGFEKIRVFDFDKVELHNLPNQFYRVSDVGLYKVSALGDMVTAFTGGRIEGVNERFPMSPRPVSLNMHGVVVVAVDSMKARKDIFDEVMDLEQTKLLVDARMGANQLEVYTCNLDEIEDVGEYKRTLWSDEETAPVPCTQRAVMYNVLNIASWITNQIRLVLSHKEYHRQIVMDLETMTLVLPERRVE